mgnify:CR=1 FL=1
MILRISPLKHYQLRCYVKYFKKYSLKCPIPVWLFIVNISIIVFYCKSDVYRQMRCPLYRDTSFLFKFIIFTVNDKSHFTYLFYVSCFGKAQTVFIFIFLLTHCNHFFMITDNCFYGASDTNGNFIERYIVKKHQFDVNTLGYAHRKFTFQMKDLCDFFQRLVC